MEPPILELTNARLLEHDTLWYGQRLPIVEARPAFGRAFAAQLAVFTATQP